MYEHRNLYDDFLGSDAFKAIEPDAVAWEHDSRNGFYIITSAGEKKPIPYHKLDQAFRVWANQELKGYAPYMEKYAGKKFLNDKGELEFDKPGHELNSVLKAVLNATKGSFSSSKTKIGPDSVALSLYNAQQAGKGKEVDDEGTIVTQQGLDIDSLDEKGINELANLIDEVKKNSPSIMDKIPSTRVDGKVDRKKLKEAYGIIYKNSNLLSEWGSEKIRDFHKENSLYESYTINDAVTKSFLNNKIKESTIKNFIESVRSTNNYEVDLMNAGGLIEKRNIPFSDIEGNIGPITILRDKKTGEISLQATFTNVDNITKKTNRKVYRIGKSFISDLQNNNQQE